LNDDQGKSVQLHISKPVLRGLIDTLKDIREKK
jgi:hypothetical protein